MSKFDTLFKKIELFEKLAVYGDRSSFLRAVAQNYSPPRGDFNVPLEGGSSQAPIGPQTTKEVTVVANPPIDPKVQEMLNELLAFQQQADIMPLAIDGEMGPKTKEALQKFTKRYGKPGTPAAVAQVYNEQKNQVAKRQPGAPLGPMGQGLGGIGNPKSTSSGNAGQEAKVPGPKA